MEVSCAAIRYGDYHLLHSQSWRYTAHNILWAPFASMENLIAGKAAGGEKILSGEEEWITLILCPSFAEISNTASYFF